MNIQIKENIELDDIWNSEIFNKNQQTIFLSKKFLDYHPPGRFEKVNLFVFVDFSNDLFAICFGNLQCCFAIH